MSEMNVISSAGLDAPSPKTESDRPGSRAPWRMLVLGLAAGVGASLCCLPFLFILGGVSGAWLGMLTATAPYRPLFLGLTVLFFGFAFCKLYLQSRVCDTGSVCASPHTLRRQRALFWTIAVVVSLLIGIPWYMPYLLG